MKKLIESYLPDALGTVGAAAVSAGVGMINRPAGVVVAGLFLLAAAWLIARGQGK